EISSVGDKDGLLLLSGELNRIGVQIPAAIYVNNDEKQSDQYITYITQSGLGLPDRDWYLTTDDTTHVEARAAYAAYIDKVLGLAGYSGVASPSEAIMAIEHRLAEAQWDRVKNRQPDLTYNKLTLEELQAMAPQVNWAGYLDALGVSDTTYIVNQPSFLEGFAQAWADVSLADWQAYYSFKAV